MPRTTLQSLTARPDELSKVIEKRLIDTRTEKRELAKYLGISDRTMTDKFKYGKWTYAELYDVFAYIKLPNDIILKVFGRG